MILFDSGFPGYRISVKLYFPDSLSARIKAEFVRVKTRG